MKKYYSVISICLLAALFLYLFYRNGDTVVNRIAAELFSDGEFGKVKTAVQAALQLPNWMIFALPEALWVYSVVLLSKNLFFTIGRYSVKCIYIPLLFAYVWELFQLTGITKGRFDFLDLSLCTLAYFLANAQLPPPYAQIHIFKHFSLQTLLFFIAFAIVYLSHVV